MRAEKTDESLGIAAEIGRLGLADLRAKWAVHWGKPPHARLGRRMLEVSLGYKMLTANGHAGLSGEQQKTLQRLVKEYRQAPKRLNSGQPVLKPGMQLQRRWKGKDYTVTVQPDGFEFDGKHHSSLSSIANQITGTRWNGWLFFGVKKQ